MRSGRASAVRIDHTLIHTGRMSPDIDRAAEGISRSAPAAIAGAADAGVRARHRARRGHRGGQRWCSSNLRKIVRGTGGRSGKRPRTDDPARLLFRPLEPFLVDGNFPIRPRPDPACVAAADLARGSDRDGAPRPREFEATRSTARGQQRRRTGGAQIPARRGQRDRHAGDAGSRSTTASACWRVSARPTWSRTCSSIGSLLQAREALETLNGKLPSYMRVFRRVPDHLGDRLRSTCPRCRRPCCCRSRCSLIIQRLTAPWQIIRLALKMAASDDELRAAATPMASPSDRAARSVLPRGLPAHRHPPRPFRQRFRAAQIAA